MFKVLAAVLRQALLCYTEVNRQNQWVEPVQMGAWSLSSWRYHAVKIPALAAPQVLCGAGRPASPYHIIHSVACSAGKPLYYGLFFGLKEKS